MQLRDYQINAIEKGTEILNKYNILYLALETRTGKTITALNICKKFNNVLFLTKKKAIDSILSDYQKGGFEFNIEVINYESIHHAKIIPDVIVCDESHGIGQQPKPNNRAKAVKKIVGSKPVIFLSATPCPETWSQLFHQFWVSSNSPFKQYANFYRWAQVFVNVKKKYVYNREVNDYTDADKKRIWSIIQHLFITTTQAQAGFKVEVNEHILTVPMPDELKLICKDILNKNIHRSDTFDIVADTAVKVMGKLHQLSSGTVISENNEYLILSQFKAVFLSEWGNGKKIVIFYKFKSEFELLKQYFTKWTDNAFEFQNSTDKTFLGQFQSAREGIRLDSADAIVFFNIDFSYLSYQQARNRIASFERKEAANLYWLFSDVGIERKIYKAVMNKSDYTLKIFKNDYYEGVSY